MLCSELLHGDSLNGSKEGSVGVYWGSRDDIQLLEEGLMVQVVELKLENVQVVLEHSGKVIKIASNLPVND